MFRLILITLIFLLSLLCVFPIPFVLAWHPAIAVTEFPWVWLSFITLLLIWTLRRTKYRLPATILCIGSTCLLLRPLISAAYIAAGLDARIEQAFGVKKNALAGFHRSYPFRLQQMISGIGAAKVPYTTLQYAPGGEEHSLRYFKAAKPGLQPCLFIVHGGSWKSGNSGELPDVPSYFAKAGYQVVSINYRLAPQSHFPAQQEDVRAAIRYLKAHGTELNIDTNNFVLLGRSAGGQIVLNAAYALHEPGIKGVMGFYGPADMIFGYRESHNQLVMHHREVMEDFLGGSPAQMPAQYEDASPVDHVTAASVPTLLVHGELDQHVHFAESERLHRKLDSAGVPNLLLALPWATHGCEYSLNGPSGQLAVYAMERFLYAVTRKGNNGVPD